MSMMHDITKPPRLPFSSVHTEKDNTVQEPIDSWSTFKKKLHYRNRFRKQAFSVRENAGYVRI